MGSMCVRDSQLGSMRIDLVRGQERRSTTETDAAEIDFMNIKQPGGSILGRGCYSQLALWWVATKVDTE